MTTTTSTTITIVPRERKPPPTPKVKTKVIRDSDIRWTCPKMLIMLRMHYLVGVSHFAKYGTNRALIV